MLVPMGAEDLQLNEARPGQRRYARGETLTLILLLIVMAATGLGVFGRGLLSTSTVTSTSGQVSVQFERFERYGALTRVRIDIQPQTRSELDIEVSSDYLQAIHLQDITPRPASERVTSERVVYTFATRETGPLTIHFDFQPMRRGRIDATLAVNGEHVRWWHFIYP